MTGKQEKESMVGKLCWTCQCGLRLFRVDSADGEYIYERVPDAGIITNRTIGYLRQFVYPVWYIPVLRCLVMRWWHAGYKRAIDERVTWDRRTGNAQ